MTDPIEGKRSATLPTNPSSDPQFDSLRSILLDEERRRIEQLEQETEALQEETQVQAEATATQIDLLQAKVDALQQENQQQQEYAQALQAELELLREDMRRESQALVPRLIQEMGSIISKTIQEKRDELAEALGPIMSDAIRVQIRDSRKEMVEALYPIILETVMRAIREYLREFQRNIDARLRSTFNARGFFSQIGARLRGVSVAELTLRQSFDFSVEELFLIQHESGLLLAHHSPSSQDSEDSDLIGGMLTAIRDFARDSFGDGDDDQELSEVEFGDERIIIQSGQYLYAAAVIKGIEPSGFHARLQEMVSELHIQHKPALRDFEGDPATLPDLAGSLAAFSERVVTPEEAAPEPMSSGQRWLIVGGAGIALLLAAVACFYLQFTIALWPLAFGSTPTPTATSLPTLTASAEPTALPSTTLTPPSLPSATFTATPLPTGTNTPTAVPPTSTNQPTATFTLEPTSTATPVPAPVTVRDVWVRDVPDIEAPTIAAIPANTAVTVLSQSDDWVNIEWIDESNRARQGWLGIRWLTVDGVPLSAIEIPGGE